MNRSTLFRISLIAVVLVISSSCSTKKDRWVNRAYHNVNSKFNGYYNADLSYKEGVAKIETSHDENFRELLPIFIYSTEKSAPTVYSQMDKAIKKTSKVIDRHSMRHGGKEKVKWIDDSYLIMGKSYFYKREFTEAEEVFVYINKAYQGTESMYEATLWKCKIHIEREEFFEAADLLERMENNRKFPFSLRANLYATYATFLILKEDYEEAAKKMKEAIKYLDPKKEKERKIRYHFILAQLYQMNPEKSYEADVQYKMVISLHPPEYEFEFYSKLNRAFNYSSADGSSYDIKATLLDLLKDEKNLEFRDEIYYALSELYRQEGDEEKQIRTLKLSTEYSVSNDYQKTLSFLTLADLYFERPEYEPAQIYYDSCVTYMPEGFPNEEAIKKKSASLNDLIKNLKVIAFEDSVQQLAQMSEDELAIFLEDFVQNKKEEDERRKEEEKRRAELAANNQGFNQQSLESNSKWYFYNPNAVNIGKTEFKRTWGDRPNEDNWRRKDKSSVQGELDELNAGAASTDSAYAVSTYKKFIPLDDSSMTESNMRIKEAYNNLGIIYSDDMEDFPRAISSLEKLIERFDTSSYHLPAYYRLYRWHTNEGNASQANFYKGIILNEYSDSEYALIIRDPNYQREESDNIPPEEKKRYQKMYDYYRNGYHKANLTFYEENIRDKKTHYYKDRMDLIWAISIGKVYGKDSVEQALAQVINTHAGKEIGKEASAYLSHIQASGNAQRERQAMLKNTPYKSDAESEHLFLFLLPVEGTDINRVKIKLSQFNSKNHSLKGLKVSSSLMGKKYHLVTIKSLENQADALSYYRSFKGDEGLSSMREGENVYFYPITFNNYAIFYQNKKPEEYDVFFLNKYLGQGI